MCLSNKAIILFNPVLDARFWIILFFGDQEIMSEHYNRLKKRCYLLKNAAEHIKEMLADYRHQLTVEECEKLEMYLLNFFLIKRWSSFLIHTTFLSKQETISLLEPGNAIYFVHTPSNLPSWYNISNWLVFLKSNIFQLFNRIPGIKHAALIVDVFEDNATIIHDPGAKGEHVEANGLQRSTLNDELSFNHYVPFYCYKCVSTEVCSQRCRWMAVRMAHFALNDSRIYHFITNNCENFVIYCCSSRTSLPGTQVLNLTVTSIRYILIVLQIAIFSFLHKSSFSNQMIFAATSFTLDSILIYDYRNNNYLYLLAEKLAHRYADKLMTNAWSKRYKDSFKKGMTDACEKDVIEWLLNIKSLKGIVPENEVQESWQILQIAQLNDVIRIFKSFPPTSRYNTNGIEIRCRAVRVYTSYVSTLNNGLVLTYAVVQFLTLLIYRNIWNQADTDLLGNTQSMRPFWFDNVHFLRDIYDLVNLLIETTIHGIQGEETGVRMVAHFPGIIHLRSLLSNHFEQLVSAGKKSDKNKMLTNQQWKAYVSLNDEFYLSQNGMTVPLNKFYLERHISKDSLNCSNGVQRHMAFSDGSKIKVEMLSKCTAIIFTRGRHQHIKIPRGFYYVADASFEHVDLFNLNHFAFDDLTHTEDYVPSICSIFVRANLEAICKTLRSVFFKDHSRISILTLNRRCLLKFVKAYGVLLNQVIPNGIISQNHALQLMFDIIFLSKWNQSADEQNVGNILNAMKKCLKKHINAEKFALALPLMEANIDKEMERCKIAYEMLLA